jgi:hypothetical protein
MNLTSVKRFQGLAKRDTSKTCSNSFRQNLIKPNEKELAEIRTKKNQNLLSESTIILIILFIYSKRSMEVK